MSEKQKAQKFPSTAKAFEIDPNLKKIKGKEDYEMLKNIMVGMGFASRTADYTTQDIAVKTTYTLTVFHSDDESGKEDDNFGICDHENKVVKIRALPQVCREYKKDGTKGEVDKEELKKEMARRFKTLAHEMRHVWQRSRGLDVFPTDSVKRCLIKFRMLEADAESFANIVTQEIADSPYIDDNEMPKKLQRESSINRHILNAFNTGYADAEGGYADKLAHGRNAAFEAWYMKDQGQKSETGKLIESWYEKYDRAFPAYIGITNGQWEGRNLQPDMDKKEIENFLARLTVMVPTVSTTDKYNPGTYTTRYYPYTIKEHVNKAENQTLLKDSYEVISGFFKDKDDDWFKDRKTERDKLEGLEAYETHLSKKTERTQARQSRAQEKIRAYKERKADKKTTALRAGLEKRGGR